MIDGGVCLAAVPALPLVHRCCLAWELSSVSIIQFYIIIFHNLFKSFSRSNLLLAHVVSFFICYYSLKPILHFPSEDLAICYFPVTPGEGCTGWGRNTCFQPDEEESERKGSRKKGRTRGCGPYREHSADARWGDCIFAEVLWSKAYTLLLHSNI